jgi:hypothetical protein
MTERDTEAQPQRQAPVVHESAAPRERLDSNESADDAAEIVQPDGEPIEREDQ